jgi:hypothetical protein
MLVWEQIVYDALDGVDTKVEPLERRITIARVVAATRVAFLWSAANDAPDQLLPTVAAALDTLRPAPTRRRKPPPRRSP